MTQREAAVTGSLFNDPSGASVEQRLRILEVKEEVNINSTYHSLICHNEISFTL